MSIINFNSGWKFNLDDQEVFNQSTYDDSKWEDIQIPHDWSVGFSFDEEKGEGCTGYLLGGIGWYRKSFEVEVKDHEQSYLNFDGIYNYTKIYINDQFVCEHEYGYSPFNINITEYLNKDGNNTIAVRVDHSRYADSRWYTGSGIYRNVQLVTVDDLHIPIWGRKAESSKVINGSSELSLDVTIVNDYSESKEFDLITKLIDVEGNTVTQVSTNVLVNTGKQLVAQKLDVQEVILWDTKNPYLYNLVTTLEVDGKELQRVSSAFGFRDILFDADKGFFLNNVNTLIKGVCLHHDGGLVGAAVPKDVWRRRLNKLIEGGCNAIRTAHNPSSEEFLDLCDELGLLVQLEFYDEWDNPKDKRLNMQDQHDDYISRSNPNHFSNWSEVELKNTMLRDRNHACIIQWSIGNEIEWTYDKNKIATGYFSAHANGNYFWDLPPNGRDEIAEIYNSLEPSEFEIGDTAKILSKWTKEMDTSRPVIANCILPSVSYESGYADALDIIGYSYRQVIYDYGHQHYPNLPIMGAENLGQWHEWKAVIDREHISGMFIWTGIDYLGESNNQWPTKATGSGLLNGAGFEKPSFHMMKTLWCDEPHIHLQAQIIDKSIYKLDSVGNVVENEEGAWKQRLWQWHDVSRSWNYSKGEMIIVEAYTNCEELELFVNDKSLGSKKLNDFEDHVITWAVPFEEGKLSVRSVLNPEVQDELVTASEPAQIILTADRQTMNANTEDVVHIVAKVVDKDGNQVIDNDINIKFDISGPHRLLGVDNGFNASTQDYQNDSLITKDGQALMILQATEKSGEISVFATSDSYDVESNVLGVTVL